MRYERRTWKMESLATGMVLVQRAEDTVRGRFHPCLCRCFSRPGRVVDAVEAGCPLTGTSPRRFVASKPGDSVQAAAAVTQVPYRGFMIYAYPFGSVAPAPETGIVEPQHLTRVPRDRNRALLRSVHPSALDFGHRGQGLARMVEVDLGPRRQPTEVVSGLTDAGNRLWVIQAAGPLSSNRTHRGGVRDRCNVGPWRTTSRRRPLCRAAN